MRVGSLAYIQVDHRIERGATLHNNLVRIAATASVNVRGSFPLNNVASFSV